MRTLRTLQPDELNQFIGMAGREVFMLFSESVGADGISIWLVDQEKTKLEVSYSEPNPDFVGWEQPLNEGLISLVLASEQPLCENLVYQNKQHSKRTDEALGQVTCSMIAVPFYLGGEAAGVLSCVQLKESPDAPDPVGFTAKHLNRISRLSTTMERLINYRVLNSILGLEV